MTIGTTPLGVRAAIVTSLFPPQKRRSARAAGTAAVLRVTRWANALMDRLVCCGGREAVVDDDADDDRRDSVATTEPQREPEIDVLDVMVDTVDDGDDTDDGSVVHDASLKASIRPQSSIVASRPTASVETRPERASLEQNAMEEEASAKLPTTHAPVVEDAVTITALREQDDDFVRSRRQVSCISHPSLLSLLSSTTSASTPTAATIDHASLTRRCVSALSSTATTTHRCLSSPTTPCWRHTHHGKEVTNTALRVYGFESDPRIMSDQQMRRLAIFRHRDAMRAELTEMIRKTNGCRHPTTER